MEETYKELLQHFEVRKWLGHEPAWKTDRGNLRALQAYSQFTSKNPTELIQDWLIYCKKAPDDITIINTTKQCILNFRQYLIDEIGISKNSAITYIARVMGFYSDVAGFPVRFTKQEKKIFRRDRGTKRKTALTVEMIGTLIDAMPHDRDKAIAMCLKASGMPVGDLLELRFRDLEFIEEYNIYLVDFARIKNEIRYITFFDPEATRFLDLYFQTEYPADHADKDFVFIGLRHLPQKQQLQVGDVWYAFSLITAKLGIVNVTPYTFRRFFTTHMKSAGMNDLYIDFMTGHITNQVKSAYDDLINSPRELLLPEYVRRLPSIAVKA